VKLAVAGSQVLLWRALQKGAGMLVALVVMQGLGPSGNGLYSLSVTTITVLAALAAGGVGLASVPRLATGEQSPRRVGRAQVLWVASMAGVLLLLALAVRLGPAWAWLTSSLGWTEPLLMAVTLAVLGMVTFETANYDLLAAGRVVMGTCAAALRTLSLALALGMVLVLGRSSFPLAITAFACAQVLAALVLAGRARMALRSLPEPTSTPTSGLWRLTGGLVRFGWLGQMSSIVYLLLLRLDQFLVEGYLDVAAVGIYAAAAWAAELLWLVPEALNPLVVHTAARAGDHGRDDTSARAVRLGLGVTALAALPLALVCEPLLGLLRDGAYLPAVTPLRVLLPGVVAFAPGVILAGDFIGRGRPHWNTQASVVTVVVNVGLCLVLIPRHGILGAAWASTVAYALGSAVMVIRFRRLTGLAWSTILLPRPSDLRF